MQPIKILIVEDDATSQLMLKTMLSNYTLTLVGSGEEALEASTDEHDLVILDINLPGIDGYDTCRQMRKMSEKVKTPIVFLSSYTALDDRLQAFDAGGNDYVSKPFDVRELVAKIDFFCTTSSEHRQTDKDLRDSHGMLMEVQTASAKLQSISRFIQASLFCHDIETLLKHFFKTAKDIGVECVLQYETSAQSGVDSTDGSVSVLEREILEMSSAMDRIHMFGQDRAIFKWSHTTLLTRKVGDMIDTLAIFMDALEAGIKSIDSEYSLLQKVTQLEDDNTALRNRVAELFKEMTSELKYAVIEIGMVTELDPDDEDRFKDLVDGFSHKIDDELVLMAKNNSIMHALISDLKTPPPELQSLMDSALEEDDGVMLF